MRYQHYFLQDLQKRLAPIREMSQMRHFPGFYLGEHDGDKFVDYDANPRFYDTEEPAIGACCEGCGQFSLGTDKVGWFCKKKTGDILTSLFFISILFLFCLRCLLE
jgi:hypothetical protein